MKKKAKMTQVYGYIICIIAIITILISLGGLITSLIDASDPLYTWGDTKNLSSFENFKMNALTSSQNDIKFNPDEATLRIMVEDAKNHKIRRVQHETKKSIIVSSVLIILCVVLFIVHWRWMQKIDKEEY